MTEENQAWVRTRFGAITFVLATATLLAAASTTFAQDTAAAPFTAVAPPSEPVNDNRGFYLRTTAEFGYGRYEYLTAGRWGGGVAFSTGLTIGAGIGERLMIGGSFIFKGILSASGESSSGDPWGPYFSPGGYFGPTLGVLGERVAFDLTLGVGGGGSSGSGGFGFIIAPALTVNLVTGGRTRVGLIVKPDLWILYDTESERPLVYAGFTAGVSLALH